MSGRIPQNDSTDEEDEFMVHENTNTTAVSSRLGSLFSHTAKVDGNASLTYKAPKQPVLKEEISKSDKDLHQKASGATDADGVPVRVLHATAAHAFLWKDGQYVSQGKLGVAVLGNRVKKDFKILLYLSNKQPVGQATIAETLTINVNANNYISFADDRQLAWSLAFENENQMLEFLKWVLAVKGLLFGDHHKEILLLDIEEGEGGPVGEGDSLEIEYTEFLVEDGPLITEFNGNLNSNQKPLRVKLGKGEAPKGWMDGLLGMKKRGKRLFLIPPDLGYSGHDSSPSFPTSSPLMVYAIARRVKFAKKTGTEEVVAERKLSTESALSANVEISNESLSGAADVAMNENGAQKSASESDVHKKVDLINRMARIGHAVMGATSTTVPAVVQDSHDAAATIAKPVAPPRPTTLQNPLAIVCVDVSLARPVITQTTANVTKSSSDGSISPRSRAAVPTTITGGVTGSQPLPYQPHPFEMNMVPIPYPSMTSSSAAMPYMYPFPYPPQSYFLQPPFLPPSCPPSSTSDFSSLASSAAASADKQLIMDEIQKCHLQLQDALTKTLVTNLGTVLKKFTDMNENIEKKVGDLYSARNSDSADQSGAVEIAKSAQMNQDASGALTEIMSKLDQIDNLVRNYLPSNVDSMLNKLTEFGEQVRRIETGLGKFSGEPLSRNEAMPPDVIERLEGLTEKVTLLQNAIESVNAMRLELATGNEWKDKHEKLKSQALSMKEKYEERIQELEDRLQQQQADGKTGTGSSEHEKVKKIMSAFYKNVSQRFPSGENFDSDAVRRIILESVKESTLSMLSVQTNRTTIAGDDKSIAESEERVGEVETVGDSDNSQKESNSSMAVLEESNIDKVDEHSAIIEKKDEA